LEAQQTKIVLKVVSSGECFSLSNLAKRIKNYMRKILFILCLLVSFYNYAQEEKKILKVTYTKTSFITPEGDFEIVVEGREVVIG